MSADLESVGLPDVRQSEIVVIAASLGGLGTIASVLVALPAELPVPVVVVQHLAERHPTLFVDLLAQRSRLPVRWLEQRTELCDGVVHVARPGLHARITARREASLYDAPRVNHARPSADLLFASAAMHCGAKAIAVVLTGRMCDGASGALAVRRAGGVVIAQDPETCAATGMPRAAIEAGAVHFVLPPNAISKAIVALTMVPGARAMFGWPRAA